ncbi:MAG: NAD-dependent epimerase/dehydratase family protein, partial [Myxococcales bacterium]|nr:NAD-dependent epimerase/dehydratase family protein [Myxococcales bacterium]
MDRDDADRRVLLTGCCGYIGTWTALALLRAGWRVRGTSVEPDYARARFDTLFATEPDGPALATRFEVVPADLLEPSTWAGLAKGCSAVVHTACPVMTGGDVRPEDVIGPAVSGTEAVVREAARAGAVRRFVHLSSVVTLTDHHRRRGVPGPERLGPGSWNETASVETDPYAVGKVEGERLARRLVGELMPEATFASVVPGVVIGPPPEGRRLPASIHKTMTPFVSGQLRWGAVDLDVPLVDVRDVADLIVGVADADPAWLAGLGSAARFICVTPPTAQLLHIADAVRARRPAFAARMPRRLLPLPRPLLLLAVRLTESREAWSYTRGMLGRRLEYD